MSRRTEIAFWGTLFLLSLAAFGGSRWAVIGLLLGFLWPSGRREG